MSYETRPRYDLRWLAADSDDNWLTRLTKLIPGEALAMYGAATGAINGASWEVLGIKLTFFLSVILVILIRLGATADKNGWDRFVQVLIPVISFGLWVLTLPEGSKPWNVPASASAWAMIVFVTFATLFYKPTTKTPR